MRFRVLVQTWYETKMLEVSADSEKEAFEKAKPFADLLDGIIYGVSATAYDAFPDELTKNIDFIQTNQYYHLGFYTKLKSR